MSDKSESHEEHVRHIKKYNKSEDKFIMRAIDFMGRVYMSGRIDEEVQAAMTSTLATVVFATDDEWERFLFSVDPEERLRDATSTVSRFQEAYEVEALRRDIFLMEKNGLDTTD